MNNDVALTTHGGGSGVTPRSYQVWGGRRHELNMKWWG